jgi:hypothetical protein
MAQAQGISSYNNNGLRQLNLGDGVTPTDGATYGQVQAAQSASQSYTDSQLAGLSSGLVEKGTVRVATTANVNLAAPGASIDGVSMTSGDLFLAAGQTTGSQNGPYVWNGSAVAASRATNWDSALEAKLGSRWTVMEGTNSDKFALLTNDSFTLGTTAAAFAFIGVSPAPMTTYTTTSPSVSSGGTWTVTHNFGTRAVVAQLWRTASPYSIIPIAEIQRPTVNTVEVKPDVALAAGEAEIFLIKIA